MNGVHDLGGMQGFGPVEVEPAEPVFHADWEAVMYAAAGRLLNSGVLANLDEFRHGIERMDPARYLASSYYERWFASVTTLLDEHGLVTAAELDARAAALAADPALPVATGVPVQPSPGPGHRFRRPGAATPRFTPGDAVCTRLIQPRGHTRLPRYVRGKPGMIHLVHGPMVFPDTNAHGLGENPQTLYNVRFEAADLWGESAEEHTAVYIDLWESYLLPAV
jgi:nitrile hydratase subunit beta